LVFKTLRFERIGETLRRWEALTRLQFEREDKDGLSDDVIVWRSDCFLIPGTPRLLGDAAAGRPTVQLTAGSHPLASNPPAEAANIKKFFLKNQAVSNCASVLAKLPPCVPRGEDYLLKSSPPPPHTCHARFARPWPGLADHEWPSLQRGFWSARRDGGLSPPPPPPAREERVKWRKRGPLSSPKLQAVNCERGDLWRGAWQRCPVAARLPHTRQYGRHRGG